MPARKIVLVVGTRPNFVKAAPLMRALGKYQKSVETVLIHTGQHYDRELSESFFEDLSITKPNVHLGAGSGSQSEQTAHIMTRLEDELIESKPDLVVVFGDVNSTLATAIVTSKLWIKLAHVEAGLRSFDNTMPEEINRIVTDRLSDYLFVSEPSGMDNLRAEGVPEEKMFFTGNIMIDSLIANLEVAQRSDILKRLALTPRVYVAMTMHRPGNVDNQEILKSIFVAIKTISRHLPVVFPCHPRTRRRLEEFGLTAGIAESDVRIIEPLGYMDFLKLQADAKFVLTDSGGVQEETTYLQVPCITLRNNTERPITSEVGTNIVAGADPAKIIEAANQVIEGNFKRGRIPDLWDGDTAKRIAKILFEKLTSPVRTR